MRVVQRLERPGDFADAAAGVIARQLHTKPQSTLALPTGNTPIGVYAELARRSRAGELDARQARVFNLDEYVGVGRDDARSYAAFIDRHVRIPLNLLPERVRLLRGDAADLEAECHWYDAAIAASGGIDLCVLGLGVNGHVAFNEPGTDRELATHIVPLSAETRAAQAGQTQDQRPVPTWGVTIGIRTILEARAILLLIAGDGKDAAKTALYRGRIDERFPVTCLTNHPDLTVIELCAPGKRH